MKKVNFLRASLAAGLAIGGMSQAQALTAAGATVSNTASVAYQVGGVAQTAVNSTTAQFVVDRLIDVTVTADNTPLSVIPGNPGYVLAFTVTNQSNATLDFDVSALQSSGAAIPSVGTDDLDMDNFTFFVDTNGNGVYNAGVDTATSINNLAAGVSIKVFAIADTPDSTIALDGKIAGVEVLVTAKNADGSAITGALGSTNANTAGMDTVYGDGDGPITGDANRDGNISVYGAYRVATASLSFNKVATIISDPINLTTNPKAIPGAVIEYCLVVTNNGTANATSIELTDHVPADTTYVTNSVRFSAAGTASSCTSGSGTAGTDVSDADMVVATSTGGANNKGTVTVSPGTLTATGGVFRTLFRVTLD